MASTQHNKAAGAWLRQARESEKRSAAQFSEALTSALGTPISTGALYAWEGGTRTVPAAALLAAAQITHLPIALDAAAKKGLVDELADELLERLIARLKDRGLDL
jgi:transcriptional regulator with XRE-family HTH domain